MLCLDCQCTMSSAASSQGFSSETESLIPSGRSSESLTGVSKCSICRCSKTFLKHCALINPFEWLLALFLWFYFYSVKIYLFVQSTAFQNTAQSYSVGLDHWQVAFQFVILTATNLNLNCCCMYLNACYCRTWSCSTGAESWCKC